MTIQAINAQSLRPAINFKKTEAPAASQISETGTKESSKNTAIKVAGGIAALALLGFGVYKFVKGKGAAKEAKILLEKRNATISSFEKQKLANNKSTQEAENIVENFERMRKPEDLRTYAKTRQELTHNVDWSTLDNPMKREDFMKELAQQA